MEKDKFSKYWAQVEYCHFKGGLVDLPVSRQIWNQLAEDWAALAQSQTLPPPPAKPSPAAGRMGTKHCRVSYMAIGSLESPAIISKL